MIKMALIGMLLLTGCATSGNKRTLAYEDANVAIYNVCVTHPIFRIRQCKEVMVQKKQAHDVKVEQGLGR